MTTLTISPSDCSSNSDSRRQFSSFFVYFEFGFPPPEPSGDVHAPCLMWLKHHVLTESCFLCKLAAAFLASCGHLGAGLTQKLAQGLQKTHFGSVLGTMLEDCGHMLPIFGRGWDSSLKVCLRLPEDCVEYLICFLECPVSLSLPCLSPFLLYLSGALTLLPFSPSLRLMQLSVAYPLDCCVVEAMRGVAKDHISMKPTRLALGLNNLVLASSAFR